MCHSNLRQQYSCNFALRVVQLLLLLVLLQLCSTGHALRGPQPQKFISSSSLGAAFFECATGYSCHAGTDPDRPQKVNQDACFETMIRTMDENESASNRNTQSSDRKTLAAVGVMDGHGLKGHLVTEYLRTQLPIRLRQCLTATTELSSAPTIGTLLNTDNDDDPEFATLFQQQLVDLVELGHANADWQTSNESDSIARGLTDAFLAAHLDARRDPSIPTGRSGTTCVVSVVVADASSTETALRVYTAHVGDSGAVLAIVNDDNDKDDDPTTTPSWTVTPLTSATTVQVPSERTRIERGEGRIDANGNVFFGPVGIAMTRSLGNAVLLRAGVVPIPIITVTELPRVSSTFVIAVASDGVWDVLTNEQVMSTIQSSIGKKDVSRMTNVDLDEVADKVCRQAQTAWLADLPIESKVDDTSCNIMVFSGLSS